jgi:hypothetical protein
MMPTRSREVPSYRLHKPTGQAVVRLDGRDHYPGKHATTAGREEYERLVAGWLASGRARDAAQARQGGPPDISVDELVSASWRGTPSAITARPTAGRARSWSDSGKLTTYKRRLALVKTLCKQGPQI